MLFKPVQPGLHGPAFVDKSPRPTATPPDTASLRQACPPATLSTFLSPTAPNTPTPPPPPQGGVPPLPASNTAPYVSASLCPSAPPHRPTDREARVQPAPDPLEYLGGRRGSRVPKGNKGGGHDPAAGLEPGTPHPEHTPKNTRGAGSHGHSPPPSVTGEACQ